MFGELPVGLEDPVERVLYLHEQMHDLKQSGQAVAAERLTALGGFAPAMLLALGGRVATRLPRAPSTPSRPTSRVRSTPCTSPSGACSRHFRSFRWAATCGWASRSSPTTGGSTSVSPATATVPLNRGALGHRARHGGTAGRPVAQARTSGRQRTSTTLKTILAEAPDWRRREGEDWHVGRRTCSVRSWEVRFESLSSRPGAPR